MFRIACFSGGVREIHSRGVFGVLVVDRAYVDSIVWWLFIGFMLLDMYLGLLM